MAGVKHFRFLRTETKYMADLDKARVQRYTDEEPSPISGLLLSSRAISLQNNL